MLVAMVAGLAIVGALIFIVMIHELGHFLTARAVGVRATKFYVFFPPALLKKQVGEVEYGVGAIPLGGFVRLPGMFEPTAADTHWRLEPTLEELIRGVSDPDLRLQLSSAFRALARAANADELRTELMELHAVVSQVLEQQKDTVGPFEGQPLAVYQRRLRKLLGRIEGIADDCHPRAYWRASLWRRMAVIFAGPLVNILLAFLVLFVYIAFFQPRFEQQWQVASVTKGGPAAEAGVRKGDRIVEWGGKPASPDGRAFSEQVEATRGETLDLVVERDDRRRSYTIEPTRIDGDRRVGVAIGSVPGSVKRLPGNERVPIDDSVALAGRAMWQVTSGTLKGLSRIVRGEDLDQVSSVVGIVKVAPEVERRDRMVEYVAFISLVIAIFNLLPLLPLDGGHMAFGLVEFLRRGRPLPRAAFERFSFVGLALMLGLFLIGLQNDLGLRG